MLKLAEGGPNTNLLPNPKVRTVDARVEIVKLSFRQIVGLPKFIAKVPGFDSVILSTGESRWW
jgi:hypothetical protein